MIKKSSNAPFVINRKKEHIISRRYHMVTKVVNEYARGIKNDQDYSIYVGSYGRGTAVDTSDVDILVDLPLKEFGRINNLKGDSQSRLLAIVCNALKDYYSLSDIHADGQIIYINFYDGIRFEVLPSFKDMNNGYIYPNADNGGCWLSTFPKIEQDKMEELNRTSNHLLFDTCRDMRYIRDKYFHSYHLAGIVIDSFVYDNINNWQWSTKDEGSDTDNKSYENYLLEKFNNLNLIKILYTPGSNQLLNVDKSYNCLGKVLNKLNTQDWC